MLKEFKKASIENGASVWKKIASELEKPTRQRRTVNIWKLDKHCSKDEVVAVPGKVLGSGELSKKMTVAAYSFSEQARKKIDEKGEAINLRELLEREPKGKNIRVIG